MTAHADLRVYRFVGGVTLDGSLVGALERLAPDGGGELLDALLVARDADRGDLQAVDLAIAGADGTLAALLDFRLDPRRRAALTQRTLASHAGGVPAGLLEEIAASLEAGGAILVLLHRGRAEVLDESVARCGGRLVDASPVHASTLHETTAELVAALTRRHEGN